MADSSIFKRFADWFQRTPPARFLVWTATGIVIWKFSSKAVSDILVYGAFLFALARTMGLHPGFAPREVVAARSNCGTDAWKQPAGIAFIVVLLYMACSLPFSLNPGLSLHDFKDMFKILAGIFAIPVIFNTRAKIEAALFYSATAIACVLGYDLIRLSVFLGPQILVKAHSFQPFILNHSNVASMMAGASALALFYFFCKWRRLPRRALGCLAGILVSVAYMGVLTSRGPQIAFAITCVSIGFLIPSRGGKLLWFLLAALAASILVANIERVNPRFAEKRSIANFSQRDIVWKHTWALTKQRPWAGHGYGKQNFEKTYYGAHPPKSAFHYPHPHQFWLKLLFEFGWPGLILNILAWTTLAYCLCRCVFSKPTFTARLLPGTVGLILCFMHLYGLGDYPDNIVMVAQFWLIPVALVLMKRTDDEYAA